MSNLVTKEIIEDGIRNAVTKIVIVLDTSDLDHVVVVDPADYDPEPWKFVVDYVSFSVEPGLTSYLYWDATVPDLMLTLDGTHELKFKRFGGLPDSAVNATGKITLSTNGWTRGAVLAATIVLQMVKCYSSSPYGVLLLENGGELLQENLGAIVL